MNDKFEGESAAGAALRWVRLTRRIAVESVFGIAYVAAVLAANRFSDSGSALLASGAVAAAIFILGFWYFQYVGFYRSLDEFERVLELKAMAIAGGVVIWIAAASWLVEEFLGASQLRMVLLAPVYAVVYLIARVAISLGYRYRDIDEE